MDDTEAEAVLQVLGQSLVWVKKPGRSYWFAKDVEIAVSDRPIGEFQVGLQRNPEDPEAEAYLIDFAPYVSGTHRRFVPERTYTSRAAAKAACERYVATRQWE